MQRQLKFRVWDKLEKRFIYPDKGYQGHYVLSLDGKFHNLQNGSGGDECVVQQYTGLKDSKGIDIYEGDLVKFLEENIPFQVMYLKDTEGCYYGLVSLEDSDYGYSLASDSTYEVIGNIFENSEL